MKLFENIIEAKERNTLQNMSEYQWGGKKSQAENTILQLEQKKK